MMNSIQVVLAVSILLCSLVSGLVFAFAVVVMPGIRALNDHDFLRAFKAMDRVIQNNHPIFLFVWLGSALAVVVLSLLSIWQLDGGNRVLAIVSSVVYLLGVQLPTVTINIPLNNQLQSQDLESLTESEIQSFCERFEPRWMRWNTIRTVLATVATAGLITLAVRI